MTPIIRKIDIVTINKKKVIDTIDKVNIIVEKYADVRSIPWVYNTYFYIVDDGDGIENTELVILKRINFIREFYHKDMGRVYENSPFNTDKTMYEIIQLYVKDNYYYYLQIENFITKFLYGMPDILTEEDFVDLNKLFHHVKKYEKSMENNEAAR